MTAADLPAHERPSLDPPSLLGRWRFDRTVDDDLTGSRMRATGEATFEFADDGLISWRETGTLQHPDGAIPVESTRSLRRAGAGTWRVEFADGRDFHPWAVGGELVHDCAPDRYVGRVDPAPAGFRTEWRSSGPHKSYLLTTLYVRA